MKSVYETRLREHGCVVHDGIVYNKKGYRICGVMNQHDKPCQRIGHCPFHNTNVTVDGHPSHLPEVAVSGDGGGETQEGVKEEMSDMGLHLPPKKGAVSKTVLSINPRQGVSLTEEYGNFHDAHVRARSALISGWGGVGVVSGWCRGGILCGSS